ncbi:Thioredoxin [Salegentibacter echinorum]|uniref:Thioredoxin n=1 Tax=Salegentibacter echinorum TaxID=1073325 RepID=A0A1M5L5P2_SALEC|nr:thioredoxin family protein [Salegentibacter echinorum]SHG60424.1 Thioredoxin [Salegentibacter echinorum]
MINKALIIFLSVFMSAGNSSQKETIINQEGDLIGEFSQENLEKQPYSSWFTPGYEQYKPNKEAFKTIKRHISDYEILLFMGTWCGDSQYEVPKFYKLLDQVDYNKDHLTSIGVNYSKKAPGDLDEKYNVHRVPTIIFLKDGEEVNRYVEFSVENLEKDIAKIVSEERYKNPYAE